MEPEDMAEEVIRKLKDLNEKIAARNYTKVNYPGYATKKNSHIHLTLESALHDAIKLEASEKGIAVTELCRQKMRERLEQPSKVEIKLDNLDRKISLILKHIMNS